MECITDPVFVLGSHKNGTSLLYVALASHPAFSGIAADADKRRSGPKAGDVMSQAGLMEGQRLGDLPETLRRRDGVSGRWATDALLSGTRHRASDAAPGEAASAAAAYREGMVDPALRLCEKSPPNVVRATYLQALFPDASFASIVRGPYAVVAATARKRTKWGSVRDQAEHWANAYDALEEDRPALSRSLVVRYEDLVARPREVLGQVCDFLSTSYDDAMQGALRIEPGRNESEWERLDSPDLAIVTEICRAGIDRYGYPVRAEA